MSVWPQSVAASACLTGSEGALVCVSIDVAPRHLESLLEALAQADFPINPQIYHDAAISYFYDDGAERTEAATLVEFPAYAERLEGLRRLVESFGFDPTSVAVSSMLDRLHADGKREPAPDGAAYRTRLRRKAAGLVRTAPQ